MLWSPSELLRDAIPVPEGIKAFNAVRVVLKLKQEEADKSRIPYKIRSPHTIIIEEGNPIEGTSALVRDGNFKKFTFDEILDVTSKYECLNSTLTGSSIDDLFEGYNVTIMTYGQVGTGKTLTMFGNKQTEGLIQSICRNIYSKIESEMIHGTDFAVTVSFLEVYSENLRDLLASPQKGKSLKMHHDPKSSSLNIKDLQTVSVTSFEDLLSYVALGLSTRNSATACSRSHRSNVILKIFLEQRNYKDEIIKSSSIQLVDLAGSDKLDRHSEPSIPSDEIKKINLSIDTLDNVVRSLAGTSTAETDGRPLSDSHRAPYRDSNLTKLLQEAIGGNSKTTVLLACSTSKQNQEETLNTLNFGANMKMVKNHIQQNKSGLNSKSILEMRLKNLDVKEENYVSYIHLLKAEIEELKDNRQTKHVKTSSNEALVQENAQLKEQNKSLSQLLNNSNLHYKQKSPKNEGQSEMTQILMEKCEEVIQLQMKLDNEISRGSSLDEQLSYKLSKEKAMEGMNLKLLEQLHANEQELKELLSSNSMIRGQLHSWSNVANTQSDKIKNLENTVKELSNVRQDLRGKRRSSGSSSTSTMVQIEEDPLQEKGSWFFGHPNPKLWGSKKVSNGSAISISSQEPLKTRVSKNGLNLHVIRLAANENDVDETKDK